MVCTTSIGPGATNMVTAAALAHVNRLPVLLLPGDVYASRRPDPVLQQVEDFGDGTISANDCFRPVSRYFDRITRPGTDSGRPAARPGDDAGSRDLRAGDPGLLPGRPGRSLRLSCEAFERRVWNEPPPAGPTRAKWRRWSPPIKAAKRAADRGRRRRALQPGGSDFADGWRKRPESAGRRDAGRQGACAWNHPATCSASIGVTGSSSPPMRPQADADLVVGVGTRLQDFTTGLAQPCSPNAPQLVQINVQPFDAHKHGAQPVVGDAGAVLDSSAGRARRLAGAKRLGIGAARRSPRWTKEVDAATAGEPESGASERRPGHWARCSARRACDAVVVCAAGGLPGELHKLWRTDAARRLPRRVRLLVHGLRDRRRPGREDGRARPRGHGDGRRRQLSDDEFRAGHLGDDGTKLIVTVLDNRGLGCINRLQQATGGAPASTTCWPTRTTRPCPRSTSPPMHASLGARCGESRRRWGNWRLLWRGPRRSDRTYVVVIETDPLTTTEAGGCVVGRGGARGFRCGRQVNAARARIRGSRSQQRTRDCAHEYPLRA